MINHAATALAVPESTLQAFCTEDPFNTGNILEGCLCRQSDHRYGALWIHRVNGQDLPEPEVVYCTPKLRYPFGRTDDGDRRYCWPEFSIAYSFEKLDGTNVCSYSYPDATGKRYVTFKTRLTPVLRAGYYGDFLGMWNEILDRYPQLRCPHDVYYGKVSLSYELYGYRNPITIAYGVDLAVRLLFAVYQLGAQPEPPVMPGTPSRPTGFPREIVNQGDPVALIGDQTIQGYYEDQRATIEQINQKRPDGLINGHEGTVLYLLTDQGWQLYKLKPESIEKVHWSAGSIPQSVVTATAWNALESCQGPLTAAYIQELLAEEFTPQQIGKSAIRIQKAVQHVTGRVKWRQAVLTAYRACGIQYSAERRGDVMRALSGSFSREEMKDVFNALRELGIAR